MACKCKKVKTSEKNGVIGYSVKTPCTECKDKQKVINDKNEKSKRIQDIKLELSEIDRKSIRALRANDQSYIDDYEGQAIALRTELNSLVS